MHFIRYCTFKTKLLTVVCFNVSKITYEVLEVASHPYFTTQLDPHVKQVKLYVSFCKSHRIICYNHCEFSLRFVISEKKKQKHKINLLIKFYQTKCFI